LIGVHHLCDWCLQTRFAQDERVYKAFLEILNMYRKGQKTITNVYDEVCMLLGWETAATWGILLQSNCSTGHLLHRPTSAFLHYCFSSCKPVSSAGAFPALVSPLLHGHDADDDCLGDHVNRMHAADCVVIFHVGGCALSAAQRSADRVHLLFARQFTSSGVQLQQQQCSVPQLPATVSSSSSSSSKAVQLHMQVEAAVPLHVQLSAVAAAHSPLCTFMQEWWLLAKP